MQNEDEQMNLALGELLPAIAEWRERYTAFYRMAAFDEDGGGTEHEIEGKHDPVIVAFAAFRSLKASASCWKRTKRELSGTKITYADSLSRLLFVNELYFSILIAVELSLPKSDDATLSERIHKAWREFWAIAENLDGWKELGKKLEGQEVPACLARPSIIAAENIQDIREVYSVYKTWALFGLQVIDQHFSDDLKDAFPEQQWNATPEKVSTLAEWFIGQFTALRYTKNDSYAIDDFLLNVSPDQLSQFLLRIGPASRSPFFMAFFEKWKAGLSKDIASKLKLLNACAGDGQIIVVSSTRALTNVRSKKTMQITPKDLALLETLYFNGPLSAEELAMKHKLASSSGGVRTALTRLRKSLKGICAQSILKADQPVGNAPASYSIHHNVSFVKIR